jgi:DNA-binding CsgD family transcriptional regulator
VDEFSSLSKDGRRRLRVQGIDLEQSYRDFLSAIERGEIPERLVDALSNSASRLNLQEIAVLEYAALGLSAKETALVLGVGLNTIKNWASSARLRLGARNTTHAVALAVALGLLFQNGR